METPIPESYWVVAGKLLAGEYPGSITDSAAPGKVQSFVEMGITLFIDLTETRELKPYAHLLPELWPTFVKPSGMSRYLHQC